MHADMEKLEVTCEVLKALSNPHRLYIVMGLIHNECNVKRMVEKLGMPQSTVSSHIAKLKNAGIIKGKRKGNEICYTVSDDSIRALIEQIKKELS
jgi:DNA-binding transcriptional ArsR family regulator